jgi:hypothetical protein
MNKLMIPSIDTLVRVPLDYISMSEDRMTYVCRITFDEESGQWIVASCYNQHEERWVPLNDKRRIGLMVWLNDAPSATDTHIRISAIHKSGRAAWADPVEIK